MSDIPGRTPRWTPGQWRAAEAVLDTLLDLPPQRRHSHLQEHTDDPEIRSLVESLLDSIEADDDFLSGSVESDAPELFAQLGDQMNGGAEHGTALEPGSESGWASEATPDRVGPWRVLRPIGRGGMGTVHLAERADGAFEQQVAIKLLRRGLDTDDIVARFVSERQILADLDHPGIARLLDGGATDDGRPYIVMEYVDGESIEKWCDSRKASLEERLALFAAVCDAVTYAHRNLVVHRDLKPSNILVTEAGEPKVVDFGIAKLLDADGDATMTRSPMWTPSYAAPEQILSEAVTTATDVWGLGAVLYRLLAGESMRQIDTPTPVALERAATAEPTRPSEHTNPERTGLPARRIRDDLDAIVTTATRANPAERYTTAAGLAADIRRFMDNQPVEAREPTAWYRTRKFVARRKLGVAAVTAIVLLLVAYAVTLQVQSTRIAAQAALTADERDRARLEAENLQTMTGFWMNLFLPNATEPMATRTAGEMLDLGIARADATFSDTPELHSKALIHLGRPALRMGRFRAAERLFERAVRINEASWNERYDPRLGWMGHGFLGGVQAILADYPAAEANYRRVLTEYGDLAEQGHIFLVLNSLGSLYHETGDLDAAEDMYWRAVSVGREMSRGAFTKTGEAPFAWNSLAHLGMVFADRGQLEAAENLVRGAIRANSEWKDTWNPGMANWLAKLARIRYRRGDSEIAERLLRTAVDMNRVTLGPDNWQFAEVLSALGVVLMGRGEFVESRGLLEKVLEIDRKALGEDHPATAVTKHQLATIHHRTGEHSQAQRLYEEAAGALSRGFGRDHSWAAAAMDDWSRLQEGRPPAEREWLSGKRLPLPLTGDLHQSDHLALEGLFQPDD